MTSLADLVCQMLESGVPHPIVISTIRLWESGMSRNVSQERLGTLAGTAVATQPSANAIRKRRWRDRQKTEKEASQKGQAEPSEGGVPRNVSGNALEQSIVSEPTLPIVPEVLKKEGKSNAREAKKGHRLPEDWEPDESCQNVARELGYNRGMWRDTLAEFRDYWKSVPGAKGLKLDWNATFRVRLRSRRTNGKLTNGNAGSAYSQAAELIREGLERSGVDTGHNGDGGPEHETPPY